VSYIGIYILFSAAAVVLSYWSLRLYPSVCFPPPSFYFLLLFYILFVIIICYLQYTLVSYILTISTIHCSTMHSSWPRNSDNCIILFLVFVYSKSHIPSYVMLPLIPVSLILCVIHVLFIPWRTGPLAILPCRALSDPLHLPVILFWFQVYKSTISWFNIYVFIPHVYLISRRNGLP